jgi:2-polyprenyl-3-methyl-5-hydroxy-6-metoxy-1,4-benzoquinol methylase
MTETDSAAPRYDFDAIDLDSGSVHADVVRLVGDARRVLELGPATGYMSRALRERGATVVGIEVDAEMARRAEEFCERVIVGDLDALDLDAALGEERFDAIVAADVLEHLKDPLDALKRLRPFLTEQGCFVVSVPNVAHGSVRLALLSGSFPYQEIGLLDRTHLRFFTRESLAALLDEAELGVAELHRHELEIGASEVPFDAASAPAELRKALEADPEARTYQFVVKAIPMAREGLRELQRQLRELATLREAAARTAELEQTIAALAGREGELRRALVDVHDQLLQRDAELAERDRQVRELKVRLDRLLNSPPARVYQALKDLPGVRRVQQRRQAAFDAAMKRRG